jgi:DNA primase
MTSWRSPRSFFEHALSGSDRSAGKRAPISPRRGLDERDHRGTFRIGFAPDSDTPSRPTWPSTALRPNSDGRGRAGDRGRGRIAVAYDRFRNRIIFPIRDGRGRVIAFGGRAMSADVPAKYLNSPDTALFHKGEVLYNIDLARGPAHRHGTVVAVEGYMDVIALARAGFGNAVAPLGTALSENQIALLWRLAAEPILCFDGDEAGRKAAYRALDLALPLLRPGHSLRFAFMPAGVDPDDLLRDEGPQALAGALTAAAPLVEVLWRRSLDLNDRSTPERRARFEADLRAAAGVIADATVRSHYMAELNDRLRGLWAAGRQSARSGALQGRTTLTFRARASPARKPRRRVARRALGKG